MFNNSGKYRYRAQIKRTHTLRTVLIIIAAVIIIGVPLFYIVSNQNRKSNDQKQLLTEWNNGAYDVVYNSSNDALAGKPNDYFLLTIHGFSAFQLGIAQINKTDNLDYIDQCIVTLRKAILLRDAAKDGRVFYILGKAYYYKGDDYSDLSITYLEKARELSYNAADIYEYLGLAYAAAGNYRSSVEAFSQALSPGNSDPSDLLLLAIAKSYIGLNDNDMARSYLMRCLDVSKDAKTSVTAGLLLAEIYSNSGDLNGAEKQYQDVLKISADNAQANFQLGELYASRGDMTKARSYWRDSLKTDPSNQKARARLGL